jgi:hypothetical protein
MTKTQRRAQLNTVASRSILARMLARTTGENVVPLRRLSRQELIDGIIEAEAVRGKFSAEASS